jgi:two-component system nitrogen regulation response regulator NtrX
VESKRGRFELADEGTLFLDEIGDMSLRMQAKVLRVLQEQKFQSVGGSKTIQVNVRVIAATNKDLEREIQRGTFRDDLYFRLNVIPLHLPPLRERSDDVPLLVEHFLAELAREHGRRSKSMSAAALEALGAYHWPGNVRELKNIVERIVIMVGHDTVEVSDLPPMMRGRDLRATAAAVKEEPGSLRDAREDFERQFILRKLEELNWNITRTADALGLERSNLHRKLKAFGITVDRKG